MAFSDYKHISQVQQKYQIKYLEERFIVAPAVEPPPQFIVEFDFNRENLDLYASEASRAELIILPLLREVYKPYAAQSVLWIQKPISCDETLNGTPDYLVATRSELGKTVLAMPLLMIAEAKRNDFELGWGQCLAELVAAQRLNGNPNRAVYGIVTDGRFWEFGKLVRDNFTKNGAAYSMDDLPELFGALHFIFQAAVENGQILLSEIELESERQQLAAEGKLRLGEGVIEDSFWDMPAPEVPMEVLQRAIKEDRNED